MTVHSVETTINIELTNTTASMILESEMDVERFLKAHHVDVDDYVLLFERKRG